MKTIEAVLKNDPAGSRDAVIVALRQHIKNVAGIDATDPQINFFRLGLSSIMLTQLKQRLANEFEIDVPMRHFYDQTDTLTKLAGFIIEQAPPAIIERLQRHDGIMTHPPVIGTLNPIRFEETPGDGLLPPRNALERILYGQLQLMSQQLDALAAKINPVVPEAVTAEKPVPSQVAAPATAPLSSAQKRLYFLSGLEGGEAACHLTAAAMIEGPLNIPALKKAFERLIARHAILRTGFQVRNNELVQITEPSVPFTVAPVEITSDAWDECLDAFAQPFKLESPPLIRIGIAEIDDAQRTLLVMDAHHIVFDGTSFTILMQEWLALYEGRELPPPIHQYQDYVTWEQDRLRDSSIERQKQFWRSRFKGDIPELELPTDYARPARRKFNGRVLRQKLPPEQCARIYDLAHRTRTTPFMVLLTAFSTLLAKWTHQEDIVIGTPIDIRSLGGFDACLGMFVNTLALRTRPRSELSFSEFLDTVKGECLEAFDHQEYPFEMLVDALHPERNLARNPLFDVMFVYENEDARILEKDGLVFQPYDLERKTTTFDLLLEVMAFNQVFTLHWGFCTALFKADTIRRMMASFETLLAAITENSDRRLAEIDILTADERHLVGTLFNQTQVAFPQEKSVVELVEAQAIEHPQRPAVVFNNRTTTYAALNRRAEQIAGILQALHQIRQDDIVVVQLHPSALMLPALLAIAKLGAVFVPVEPSIPDDRLQYILTDSRAKLMVCESSITNDSIPCCCLEHALVENADKRFARPFKPRQLFYIIYTSGTTGQPKGTMVTNRSLVNYLTWFTRAFDISPNDRFLLTSSFAFDMAHTSLWAPLLTGAAIHLISREDAKDPGLVTQSIAAEQITGLKVTPSFFNTLVNSRSAGRGDTFASLRLVILGGEDIRQKDIETYLQCNPNGLCVNEYGPTEATIATIFHPITCLNVKQLRHRQIIGKPIANTAIRIVNPAGQLVPVGVKGEIWISGANVAQGYLNREALTKDKFRPDPFDPRERIYRTGDYGRWLPDGTIEFFGRIDQQIKIRGYRVEPGEIEQTLLGHADIDDAYVTAQTVSHPLPDLVAYLVGRKTLSTVMVRDFLSRTLPDYMIPAYFVMVDRIPLTPNGKVDRKALPDPLDRQAALPCGSEYAAPRKSSEKALCEIWSAVLGRQTIGIRDNYFALGGDSIKAVLIVSRMLDCGYHVTIRDIFEHPTIARLATRLTGIRPPVPQAQATGRIPLTPIQALFFKTNPEHGDHCVLGVLLTARERLNEKSLVTAVNRLLQRHDCFRTVFRFENGSAVQTLAPATPPLVLETIRLTSPKDATLSETARLSAQMAEVPGTFDMGQAPLIKIKRFWGQSHDYLAVWIHHLIVDGISWRIILDELQRGFDQADLGVPQSTGVTTDSYQSWSERLTRYRNQSSLKSEIPYWEAILREYANIPLTATPPPTNRISQSKTITAALNPERTGQLLTGIHHAYHTTAEDMLLAALARALRTCFDTAQFRLDMESHGRHIPPVDQVDATPWPDISRTLGWFTTLFPLGVKLSADGDLSEDIRRVRAALRDIPRHGMGFNLLNNLPDAKGDTHFGNNAASHICFNYLGRFEDALVSPAFQAVQEITENTRHPLLQRWHLIDIEAIIPDDRLEISLTYNHEAFSAAAMTGLLDTFLDELRTLIRHCRAIPGHTLPAAPLTYSAISDADLLAVLHECRVTSENVADICPLSPTQSGMLFHFLLNRDTTAFFEQFTFHLQGTLDIERFSAAWQLLIDSYDSLRTTFSLKAHAHPLQVVLKHRAMEFEIVDIADQPPDVQENTIRIFQAQDRERGFDLQKDVLMRVRLFIRRPDAFTAVWSHHHIISDGWSSGILIKALLQAYNRLAHEADFVLPAAPAYTGYIKWLEQNRYRSGLPYWQNYLKHYTRPAGFGSRLSEGQAADPFELRRITHAMTVAETRRFAKMAETHQVTLNTALQSLWGVLLACHSGLNDVVFGMVVSGRPADLEDVSGIVGLFLNTIPVRLMIDWQEGLPQLMKRLQKDVLSSEPNSYVSLADIQQTSPLKTELFDNIIVFENYPLSLEIETLSAAMETGFQVRMGDEFEQTDYDLVLEIYPRERLTFNFKYNAAIFTAEQINELNDRLCRLVTLAIQTPDILLSDLRAQFRQEEETAAQKERLAFIESTQKIDEDF